MCSQPNQNYETQGDVYVSDCESGTSTTHTEDHDTEFSGTSFVRMDSEESAYSITEKKLTSLLSSYGYDAKIEAMYKNKFSTVMSQARLQSFQIYSSAMNNKRGGNSNEVYTWYGASMPQIRAIIDHGFCFPATNGIHLSPIGKPLYSLLSAAPEANGIRYMLLCRVILGKSEVIHSGSSQFLPSCVEFDSGVDSLSSPGKYTVWSSNMNTHILPTFMISLKASPSPQGCRRRMKLGCSDIMPFPKLIGVLSRLLPGDAIELICRLHGDYKREKMSRRVMVEKMRNIVGDKLLLEIVKRYRRMSR